VRLSKTAVLIVGHGSRLKGFKKAIEKVASSLRRDGLFFLVQCAYLEVTPPSIPDAIDACVRKGAREVRILPYFLLMGNHVKTDIPEIALKAGRKYRGKAKITLCPYLGFHEKIVAVVKERLKEVG
jgi:sirohydrochlorin ferrochelatase